MSNFSEDEHPRNPKGEFQNKPGANNASNVSLSSRMDPVSQSLAEMRSGLSRYIQGEDPDSYEYPPAGYYARTVYHYGGTVIDYQYDGASWFVSSACAPWRSEFHPSGRVMTTLTLEDGSVLRSYPERGPSRGSLVEGFYESGLYSCHKKPGDESVRYSSREESPEGDLDIADKGDGSFIVSTMSISPKGEYITEASVRSQEEVDNLVSVRHPAHSRWGRRQEFEDSRHEAEAIRSDFASLLQESDD